MEHETLSPRPFVPVRRTAALVAFERRGRRRNPAELFYRHGAHACCRASASRPTARKPCATGSKPERPAVELACAYLSGDRTPAVTAAYAFYQNDERVLAAAQQRRTRGPLTERATVDGIYGKNSTLPRPAWINSSPAQAPTSSSTASRPRCAARRRSPRPKPARSSITF